MEKVLLQHFQKIAKETSEDRYHFTKKFTQYIPKLVTSDDNFNLNRLVTMEEIEEAAKEMQNGKAPGLDGFNVDFFKACWRIVKQDILENFGFQRESLPVKYLGVPLTDKLLHKDIWEPTLNKLKDNISKWTNKALNLAGRLVLTKVVLQSIPIYVLSTIPALAVQ
eukprot:PITA_14987